jgi:hypothetical protein
MTTAIAILKSVFLFMTFSLLFLIIPGRLRLAHLPQKPQQRLLFLIICGHTQRNQSASDHGDATDEKGKSERTFIKGCVHFVSRTVI